MSHQSHIDDYRSQKRLRINQWPPKFNYSAGYPTNLVYNLTKDFGGFIAKYILKEKFLNLEYMDYINKEKEGVIFVSNHDSGFDPLYIASKFKSRIHSLGVDNPMLDISIFRKFFEEIGVIAVAARGNVETMNTARKLLLANCTLLIYPEANFVHKYRNIYGHTGIAILASQTGRPVFPFGVQGVDYKHFLLFLPPLNTRVKVQFCIPRYVKEEYRISKGGFLEKEVARGITDEIMFDIRNASKYNGLTLEHAKTLYKYFKNFKTNKYTYQDPNLL